MKPVRPIVLAAAISALVLTCYGAWMVDSARPRNYASATPAARPESSGEVPKLPASLGAKGEPVPAALPEVDLRRARTDLHPTGRAEEATPEVDPTRPDRTDWAIDGVDAGYEKCRACILDPMAPRLKKASALRYLNDGPEDLTPDVLQAAVDLIETTMDPKVRACLCWGLVAIEDEAAIQALLRRLRVDMDEGVREWAVSALGPSTSREDVHSALEHVWRHDASEVVRERAREVIGGRE